ncbi:efflux RND transporter periplasmic adaptor subunit [Trinickia mobilis]|uniref:efflux RND transporter periplasmic adaptor subunit n=1 Tax=Trinickia mobilis TaxID=2816356 RepID=UPI001A8DAE1D|nr:efflux RND transporter periplasmic adaptor subunit [Trinickia mobilis]
MSTQTEVNTEVEVKPSKGIRRLKLVGICAALIAVGIVTTGILSRARAKQQLVTWTNEQTIPTVATIKPKPVGATQPLVLPGTLAAEVNAPIYARVSGYLHAWYADIGAHVKAGQLLGEIDTPDLDQELQQAQADLQNSIANEQLAETTAKRWTEMLGQQSVSQQEADEKTSDLVAKAATVDARRANVRRLQALESFKKLIAPFDGIVTARKTDVGQLIDVGSGNGPELFTVSDAKKMRVYVSVPQVDAAAIQPELSATLTVPERPGMTFTAKLVDTDQAIAPESGTLLVQLTEDNTSGLLFPGEYTQVHFALPAASQAVAIPASALIFRAEGLQVAVVDANSHARLRDVRVGTDYGSTVEIVSGLKVDDRVIDNPPDSLAEGDVVRLAHDGTGQTDGSMARAQHTAEPGHA